MLQPIDVAALIHPALMIVIVFPLLGMVLNYALQTRERRLVTTSGEKSKIPPIVGGEHLRWGRWLSNAVVGITLVGLAYPIFSKLAKPLPPDRVLPPTWFVVLMFVLTIASLVMLNRAQPKVWRAVFATLTGMGLVILGSHPFVFRREFEWYVSHYYYGIAAAFLMIFSLAIVPDIYKDRSNRWRTIHVVLNCVAVLLFISQGVTGTRDLLEIPLSWQESHLFKCDFANLTCPP